MQLILFTNVLVFAKVASNNCKEDTKQPGPNNSKPRFDFNSIYTEYQKDSEDEKFFDLKAKASFPPKERIANLWGSNYFIIPQMEMIARMTEDQLGQVYGLVVGNDHGYIQFLAPIDLRAISIDDCIWINRLSITVKSPLDSIRARVVLYDISSRHVKSDKAERENVSMVIRQLHKMYRIEKSKYDKVSHCYWFIAETLKIYN